MHFQNFKTSIKFALFEYCCLHIANCLTTQKFTRWMSSEPKILSRNRITSNEKKLLMTNSPIIKGHDMSLSNLYGAVKSRLQEISQEILNNQGKISIRTTQEAMLHWSRVWTKSTMKTSGATKLLVYANSIGWCRYQMVSVSGLRFLQQQSENIPMKFKATGNMIKISNVEVHRINFRGKPTL